MGMDALSGEREFLREGEITGELDEIGISAEFRRLVAREGQLAGLQVGGLTSLGKIISLRGVLTGSKMREDGVRRIASSPRHPSMTAGRFIDLIMSAVDYLAPGLAYLFAPQLTAMSFAVSPEGGDGGASAATFPVWVTIGGKKFELQNINGQKVPVQPPEELMALIMDREKSFGPREIGGLARKCGNQPAMEASNTASTEFRGDGRHVETEIDLPDPLEELLAEQELANEEDYVDTEEERSRRNVKHYLGWRYTNLALALLYPHLENARVAARWLKIVIDIELDHRRASQPLQTMKTLEGAAKELLRGNIETAKKLVSGIVTDSSNAIFEGKEQLKQDMKDMDKLAVIGPQKQPDEEVVSLLESKLADQTSDEERTDAVIRLGFEQRFLFLDGGNDMENGQLIDFMWLVSRRLIEGQNIITENYDEADVYRPLALFAVLMESKIGLDEKLTDILYYYLRFGQRFKVDNDLEEDEMNFHDRMYLDELSAVAKRYELLGLERKASAVKRFAKEMDEAYRAKAKAGHSTFFQWILTERGHYMKDADSLRSEMMKGIFEEEFSAIGFWQVKTEFDEEILIACNLVHELGALISDSTADFFDSSGVSEYAVNYREEAKRLLKRGADLGLSTVSTEVTSEGPQPEEP